MNQGLFHMSKSKSDINFTWIEIVIATEIAGHLVPLFQNESSCKKLHTKMSLICRMKMKMLADRNTFSYEKFLKKTRFETEAKDNSEMNY